MPNGKKKILLADDEQSLRGLLKTIFEDAGYEFLEAEDGKAAWEKAKKEHPDLIILDVNMPKMTGFQVLEHLKKDGKTRDIPVIMLTTRGSQEDIEAGIRLDADKYIPKPFETKDLLHEIRQTFAIRGLS